MIPIHLLAPNAKIVLVGDPKQLPAIVLSKAAEAGNLTQSLFERLQRVNSVSATLGRYWLALHPHVYAQPGPQITAHQIILKYPGVARCKASGFLDFQCNHVSPLSITQ